MDLLQTCLCRTPAAACFPFDSEPSATGVSGHSPGLEADMAVYELCRWSFRIYIYIYH